MSHESPNYELPDLPEIHWTEIPFEPLTRTVLAVYGDTPDKGLAMTETGDIINTVGSYHIADDEVIATVNKLFPGDPKIREIARPGIGFLNRDALQSNLVLPLCRIEPRERAELVDELASMAGLHTEVSWDHGEVEIHELADTLKTELDKLAKYDQDALLHQALDTTPNATDAQDFNYRRWETSVRLRVLAQTAVNNISPPATPALQ